MATVSQAGVDPAADAKFTSEEEDIDIFDSEAISESSTPNVESISTEFDASTLRSLNFEAFDAYVNGYLAYARSIPRDGDKEIFDRAQAQVRLIRQEIDRRNTGLKKHTPQDVPSVYWLIFGVAVCLLGCGLFLKTWWGLLPMLIGLVDLIVLYARS